MNPERPAFLTPGGSTPLPNALLDTILPTLSDTELRVLLVVARSTLGWKEGRGRKGRDWLSHSQLQKRTGRSGAPVSRAIDTMVKRGLLVVQDEAGSARATARERRALRSSLFFRLGDGLLGSAALPGALPCSCGTQAIQPLPTTLESKDEEEAETALAPLAASHRPFEGAVDNPSTLETRLHFLKTTKEKQTKDLTRPLSSLLSKDTQEEGEEADAEPQIENEQVSRFLVIFDQTFRALRPQEEPVKPDEADLTRLHSYFERGYGNALEKWLPAFFACSFGFVTRRNYSLHAYLHCFFSLQAQSGAIRIISGD